MCRWLAWQGSPTYINTFVFEQEHSLIKQAQCATKAKVAVNGDGFGLSWYGSTEMQRRTPAQYREILPAWNDNNLLSLAHHITSPLFFAHVRASTGTSTTRANCHPFISGKWSFMDNGQVGDYQSLRRSLETLIDDDFYPDRLGTTDSELHFLSLLTLFKQGLSFEEAWVQHIKTVLKLQKEKKMTTPIRSTSCLSDGHKFYILRYSSDSLAPSLFWKREKDGILVVSEPLDEELESWTELPKNHFMICEGSKIETKPFIL